MVGIVRQLLSEEFVVNFETAVRQEPISESSTTAIEKLSGFGSLFSKEFTELHRVSGKVLNTELARESVRGGGDGIGVELLESAAPLRESLNQISKV